MKDYYSILELPVTASQPEIKKAYRKLAMQFHPDKRNDDRYADAKFTDIKEAYEVLTNPGKKELYLQERWLSKASGKINIDTIITPPNVLIKSLELNKQIAMLDIYRMDAKGISERIIKLLNEEVLEKLNDYNETEINETIIDCLLSAAKPLPYGFSTEISKRLVRLAGTNEVKINLINSVLLSKQKKEQAQKFEVLLIFLAVGIICLLIFLTGT